MMNKSEDLVKKSKISLFKTLNCCESQIIPIQALYDVSNTNLRKSVTGLAGGINNSGSTCGAVFGGALNLAIMHRTSSQSWDISSEINLIHAVQKFVNSFEQEFRSVLCRERTGLDLKKLSGKIGLLIPSIAKICVKQTAWTMNYISKSKISSSNSSINSIDHCSSSIFDEIKNRTGISDSYLQQLSTGLSGGIGLSGGGCTALTTGIMLLGLKYGNEDLENGKKRSPLRYSPPKFVKYANKLIILFKKKFKTLECRDITNTSFKDIENFNEYRSQGNCSEINKFIIEFIEEVLLNE